SCADTDELRLVERLPGPGGWLAVFGQGVARRGMLPGNRFPTVGSRPEKKRRGAAPFCPVAGRSALRGGLAGRRLGGGLALGIALGAERGDVDAVQGRVAQDLDPPTALAEGLDVGGDGVAGDVAANVRALGRAGRQVRGGVALA